MGTGPWLRGAFALEQDPAVGGEAPHACAIVRDTRFPEELVRSCEMPARGLNLTASPPDAAQDHVRPTALVARVRPRERGERRVEPRRRRGQIVPCFGGAAQRQLGPADRHDRARLRRDPKGGLSQCAGLIQAPLEAVGYRQERREPPLERFHPERSMGACMVREAKGWRGRSSMSTFGYASSDVVR